MLRKVWSKQSRHIACVAVTQLLQSEAIHSIQFRSNSTTAMFSCTEAAQHTPEYNLPADSVRTGSGHSRVRGQFFRFCSRACFARLTPDYGCKLNIKPEMNCYFRFRRHRFCVWLRVLCEFRGHFEKLQRETSVQQRVLIENH